MSSPVIKINRKKIIFTATKRILASRNVQQNLEVLLDLSIDLLDVFAYEYSQKVYNLYMILKHHKGE